MKIKITIIVGVLLLSSISALGMNEEGDIKMLTKTLEFERPTILETDTVTDLKVIGADACLAHPGKPIIPMYTTTIKLPFATRIIEIQCTTGEIQTLVLPKKLRIGSEPVAQTKKAVTDMRRLDQQLYNSVETYPDTWYDYYYGGGVDENGRHCSYLTLQVFPLQYTPQSDTISYTEKIELIIIYQESTRDPIPLTASTDMVIIAPSKFTSSLQKLVDHKNQMGLTTTIKTLEEIYDEYTGVDEPEQIKYYIKDAIDTEGIHYVLLVGGLKSYLYATPRDDQNKGVKGWHLPVRYTNVRDQGGTYDPGFISDLYYADIYDGEGNFSSWDTDEDGIFAEWIGGIPDDTIDLYPDVAIGRLACRNRFEVLVTINKIINYENTAHDSEILNKMILAGGDTHDDSGTNYLEGEEMCEYILENYMTDVTPVKLYASNNDSDPDQTPTGTNLIREITDGAGILFLTGHASPVSWTTHWVGEFGYPESWTEPLTINDFPKLFNRKNLPVCLVEGCHNSQFNVSLIPSMLDKDNSKHMWTYGRLAPECWSWWMTRKIGGGSIATFGHTGLSYEATGEEGDLDGDGENLPDCLEAFCGYQNRMFFKTFSENSTILGEVWMGTINKYLETFPGMDYQLDAKTVEQWALLGDPSLLFGGYIQ